MNLIFLYGPPAVGKLTIAKELQTALDYKLLYNHQLINPIEDLFAFDNPSLSKLTRSFRKQIIEEAIKNNIDLIITSGTAGSPTLFDYYEELIHLMESNKGKVYMIHLTADKQTLLKRVEDDFRKLHGKNFDKKGLSALLNKSTILFDKFSKRAHLTIDTRTHTPRQSAEIIISEYKLRI